MRKELIDQAQQGVERLTATLQRTNEKLERPTVEMLRQGQIAIARQFDAVQASAGDEALKALKAIMLERQQAVKIAEPSLKRLAEMLRGRSGQSYYVRAFLYSLWNGKPASLGDLLNLDWAVRKDVLFVCAAFGHADRSGEFFYRAIENAVRAACQWQWFLEEGQDVEQLRAYVAAADREKEAA